jgi:uroporphyrinogen decarboxylase
MNGAERTAAIFEGGAADKTGFWLGNPTPETKALYCRQLGIDIPAPVPVVPGRWEEAAAASIAQGRAEVELATALGSDLVWCSPELDPAVWRHPEGKPVFDCSGGKPQRTLGQPGVFADCEDPAEVDDFDWPDADHLDFTTTLERIDLVRSKGMAVVGGMWAPFFHILCDFLGMENYFIKMHTHPTVVDAITEKVLAFHLEANRRFLDVAAPRLAAFFFGNDLGSQRDLLISPASFDRFVLPGIRALTAQAKSCSLKVLLHSCGAVAKIIPRLVKAGIDGLHPLQARAVGMDAESLARDFGGDLVFVGGVDTQDLLPFHTPSEVKAEVNRLKNVFGDRFIVSPSHEALLPNVPLENVLAMRDAAADTGREAAK